MRGAWRDQRIVGFKESVGAEQSSAAEAYEDGTVSSWITGSPVQGEHCTPSAARVLVQAMNRAGGHWELGDEAAVGIVNCVLRDRVEPRRRLEVQVVRAIVEQDLYSKLKTAKSVIDLNSDPVDIATLLFAAVTKKAHRIPPNVSLGLLLALDATRLSVCTMSSVVEAYARHFGARTRAIGFAQVWLVGPTDTFTHRLDV